MNYAHLPLEERIDMAAGYVLLLMDDQPPLMEDEIISRLKEYFSLSTTQALQALQRSRVLHPAEYASANRSALVKGLVSVGVAFGVGAYYVAMGEELSGVFNVLGIFFLLAGLFNIGLVVQKALAHYYPTPSLTQQRLHKTQNANERQLFDWTITLFLTALGWMLASGFIAVKDGTNNQPPVVQTMAGVRLTQPVAEGRTGGKNSQTYLRFFFAGYANEFRFFERQYQHASVFVQPSLFRVADTFSIQLAPQQYINHIDHGEPGAVEFLNIVNKGKPFIDLPAIEQRQAASSLRTFWWSVAACLVLFVVMIVRHRLASYREQRTG